MSAGDINSLLNMWAATLAPHGDDLPFCNHTDLYNTIDSTPLGDVPWESVTATYGGAIPDGERSAWMDTEFEVWFRDPKQLVENMIANPDFNGEFDCSPFQEYDTNNNHRFCNFMSGDWAWKQAVCIPFSFAAPFANHLCRTSSPTIAIHMGPCLCRLYSEVTRQRSLWGPATINIGRCTCRSGSFTTIPAAHIEMESFFLAS
jgi:Plavaka transposase